MKGTQWWNNGVRVDNLLCGGTPRLKCDPRVNPLHILVTNSSKAQIKKELDLNGGGDDSVS